MTFTPRVTAITQDRILPKEYDNFFDDASLLPYRILGTGEDWGGVSLNVPVTLAKNNNGSSFSGLTSATLGTTQTRQSMQFNLKAYRISISLPGLDQIVASGEAAQVNLINNETHNAFLSLLDDVSGMLYQDGTGNGSQDFNGLDLLADDTTTSSTIGGLSKSTYPTLSGVRTSVGGAIDLDDLATFYMGLTSGSGVKNRPTLFVTNETVWNYLEKLIITGTIQANYNPLAYPTVTRRSKGAIKASELGGGYGFTSIIYKGVPIVYDEKATTQTLWGLNENFLPYYSASSNKLKSISVPNSIETVNEAPSSETGLQWSGWKDAFSEFGDAAFLYLIGEWITTQPRRQGRLTGITGV